MMIQLEDAGGLIKTLKAAGILIRGLASYGLNDWVRISIGTHEQMRRFTEIFTRFVQAKA